MSSNHFNDFSWFVQIWFHFLVAMNQLQHGFRQTLSLLDNDMTTTKNSYFLHRSPNNEVEMTTGMFNRLKNKFHRMKIVILLDIPVFIWFCHLQQKIWRTSDAKLSFSLALHVMLFSFSTIPFTINQSQPARENPLSYCKNMISFPLCAQRLKEKVTPETVYFFEIANKKITLS